jgi:hypothetical protein
MDIRVHNPVKPEFDGGHHIHLFKQVLLDLPDHFMPFFIIQRLVLRFDQAIQFRVGNPGRIAPALGKILLVQRRIDIFRSHTI